MGPHHQGERGILMETPPMESNEDLTPEDAHLSFLSSLEEQQPVAAMEREADVEDEEEEDNIPLGKSMPSPEDNIPLGESMPSPVLSQGIDDIIREGSSPVSVAPPAVPQKTESHQGTFPTPDPSVNQSSDSPFDLLPTSKRRLSGQTHTEVTYQEEPVYPFDSTFSRYMSRRSVDGYRFATAPSPQVTPPKPKSTNVFKGAFKKVSKWLNADEHEHVYHPAALAYDVYHPLHHQR